MHMNTLLLMGVGTNNWLGYLWILLGMAAIVQFVDWFVHYIKRRRLRRLEEHEQALSDLLNENVAHDLSEN